MSLSIGWVGRTTKETSHNVTALQALELPWEGIYQGRVTSPWYLRYHFICPCVFMFMMVSQAVVWVMTNIDSFQVPGTIFIIFQNIWGWGWARYWANLSLLLSERSVLEKLLLRMPCETSVDTLVYQCVKLVWVFPGVGGLVPRTGVPWTSLQRGRLVGEQRSRIYCRQRRGGAAWPEILVQVAKCLKQFVKTRPYLASVHCMPTTYKPRPVKMLEGSKCQST